MRQRLIDHSHVDNRAKYQCSECKGIYFGKDLDWFSDEPDLTICPVCNNRVEFFEVNESDIIMRPVHGHGIEFFEVDK